MARVTSKEQLNELQRKALDLATSDDKRAVLITGAAGTGKSTVVAMILEALVEEGVAVLATATTNKATAVFSRMISDPDVSSEARTIYSALGLVPRKVRGNVELRQVARRIVVNDYDTVAMDETSMAPSQLWDYVEAQIGRRKLILVGDPYQLPPVGETVSPAFVSPRIADHVHLTKIERTADDNPIGPLVDQIRTTMPNVCDCPEGAEMHDGLGWSSISNSDWINDIDRLLKENRDEYEADPDYMRVLAYTRDMVGWLNQHIRGLVFGEKAAEYEVNERLVADDVILRRATTAMEGEPDDVSIQNSAEMRVLSCRPTVHRGFETWALVVSVDGRCDDAAKEIYVPTRVSAPLIEKERKKRFSEARSRGSDSDWQEAYEFAESWASVSYSYALTIHKSQGSTFRKVYLHWPNVVHRNWRGSSDEKAKLLYVGATRASETLTINNGN